MPVEDPAVDDHAALTRALIAHYDEETRAWRLPLAVTGVAMRLDRFRLSWLLAPWFLISMLIRLPRQARASRNEGPLVRLYAQASGRDPEVSRAELSRIRSQLWLLDERSPQRLGLGVSGTRPADRAEFEATASALLAYYLGGRRTGDALLAEVQAAYAAYDEGLRAATTVMSEQGARAASRYRKANRARDATALTRYLTAWRRWIDNADGTIEPAAGPKPADRPASDPTAPREVWTEQLLELLCRDDPVDLDRLVQRSHARLTRFKLAWLAVPVALVGSIVSIPRVTRIWMRDADRSEGLYMRLSGRDAGVARAELLRIRLQLIFLKKCLPEGHSSSGGPALAGRAARAAAARALLGYFLTSRQTDDALLAETQAAYAALEQLNERDAQAERALGRHGRRRRRVHKAAVKQRRDAAERRYCEAWRRWLEEQPADRRDGGSSGRSDGSFSNGLA
jgi:hypothetical protein